jgi:hypothetical protein
VRSDILRVDDEIGCCYRQIHLRTAEATGASDSVVTYTQEIRQPGWTHSSQNNYISRTCLPFRVRMKLGSFHGRFTVWPGEIVVPESDKSPHLTGI